METRRTVIPSVLQRPSLFFSFSKNLGDDEQSFQNRIIETLNYTIFSRNVLEGYFLLDERYNAEIRSIERQSRQFLLSRSVHRHTKSRCLASQLTFNSKNSSVKLTKNFTGTLTPGNDIYLGSSKLLFITIIDT